MSQVEYQYSTTFTFPHPVSKGKDYSETFEIDTTTSLAVEDNQAEGGCTFTLYAKTHADDPREHDPTQYELYASELKYLYNIVRLTVAYLTGHIVKGKSPTVESADPSLFYELPNISHDFYQRAKDVGITISPRKERFEFTMGGCIVGQLTPEKLDLLCSISQSTKRDEEGVKYDVLDLYVKGFRDRVDPYFYWYHIVEIVRNPIIGFLSKADWKNTAEIGCSTIDLKFLRLFAHTRRHSSHSQRTKDNLQELRDDPERAMYLTSPETARSHYDMNLRTVVEHFILRH